jgi:hypothetical protein
VAQQVDWLAPHSTGQAAFQHGTAATSAKLQLSALELFARQDDRQQRATTNKHQWYTQHADAVCTLHMCKESHATKTTLAWLAGTRVQRNELVLLHLYVSAQHGVHMLRVNGECRQIRQ